MTQQLNNNNKNLKRRMCDNTCMWPSKSKMLPVWPFPEKRGPVTLLIRRVCLRTGVSASAGSTLRRLCCIWPLRSVSQHPPRLGSLGCRTTSASGSRLDVDTGSLTSSQRAGERGSWGVHPRLCPERRLRRARPQPQGAAPFEASDLYLLLLWSLGPARSLPLGQGYQQPDLVIFYILPTPV